MLETLKHQLLSYIAELYLQNQSCTANIKITKHVDQ